MADIRIKLDCERCNNTGFLRAACFPYNSIECPVCAERSIMLCEGQSLSVDHIPRYGESVYFSNDLDGLSITKTDIDGFINAVLITHTELAISDNTYWLTSYFTGDIRRNLDRRDIPYVDDEFRGRGMWSDTVEDLKSMHNIDRDVARLEAFTQAQSDRDVARLEAFTQAQSDLKYYSSNGLPAIKSVPIVKEKKSPPSKRVSKIDLENKTHAKSKPKKSKRITKIDLDDPPHVCSKRFSKLDFD